METKQLYQRSNTDNILVRSVIAGLLDLLNNKIDYSQIWDDSTEEIVSVPWMYDMGSSDERLMQDNFTFFGKECFNREMINGTFNSIPRGILKYNGTNIESSSITNRFIQGTYMKRVGDKLISYTSFLYSIPLTINFECTVDCDNIITALKIQQAINETFYKNKTFFVQYRGLRIGCCVGIPESMNLEKSTEYSFDSAQKRPKITFSLTVESYQPVFDKTTEIERDKYIKYFSSDLFVKSESRNKKITITNKEDLQSVTYPCGSSMLIEWKQKSDNSEMLNVFVKAIDECGNEEVISEFGDNREFFIWDIPQGYTSFNPIKITFDRTVEVVEEPTIIVVPDIKTGEIRESSFVIVKNGFIISPDKDAAKIRMSYTDNNSVPHVIKNYSLHLDGGRINLEDPIIVDDKYAKYEGELSPKKIKLKVCYENEKNELENGELVEVCDIVENVNIL